MSKFYAIHNGRRIAYWLGLLIGLDQFIGSLIPGADLDRTISHRLGVLRVKIALRQGVVEFEDVMASETSVQYWVLMTGSVRSKLHDVRIPFWRHPLAALLDGLLERIDKNHSLEAIGA